MPAHRRTLKALRFPLAKQHREGQGVGEGEPAHLSCGRFGCEQVPAGERPPRSGHELNVGEWELRRLSPVQGTEPRLRPGERRSGGSGFGLARRRQSTGRPASLVAHPLWMSRRPTRVCQNEGPARAGCLGGMRGRARKARGSWGRAHRYASPEPRLLIGIDASAPYCEKPEDATFSPPLTTAHRYLLVLGEPADPAVFVSSNPQWNTGDRFTGSDGSKLAHRGDRPEPGRGDRVRRALDGRAARLVNLWVLPNRTPVRYRAAQHGNSVVYEESRAPVSTSVLAPGRGPAPGRRSTDRCSVVTPKLGACDDIRRCGNPE